MAKQIVSQLTRTAKAIVVSPDGQYLVLVGSEWKERPDRSLKPDLPGGLIEPGEALEDGLAREIREETGLDSDMASLRLAYTVTQINPHDNESISRFLYVARAKSSAVSLSWEHSDYRWVSREEFVATKWRSFYCQALEYIEHYNLWPLFLPA